MSVPRRYASGTIAMASLAILSCQWIGDIEVLKASPADAVDGGGSGADASGDPDARKLDGGDAASEGGVPALPTSCVGLAPTCGGPGGMKSCCASSLVTGGQFYRSNDPILPKATVSDFFLDNYEVTVGRFRAFVESGKATQANPPAQGDGAHPLIPGSGWDVSFNASLASEQDALKLALKCTGPAGFYSWTDVPGANESRPITCVTWFDALAFCAWDRGRLPTEAERSYATTGGAEQREYPWGAAALDATRAKYGCVACSLADLLPAGSLSPLGDGRYGQSELSGNVWEWGLDWVAKPYRIVSCDNCADLQPSGERSVFGGGLVSEGFRMKGDYRSNGGPPISRYDDVGFRCARNAP